MAFIYHITTKQDWNAAKEKAHIIYGIINTISNQ